MADFNLGKSILRGGALLVGFTVTAKFVEAIIEYLKEKNLKAKSTKYYAKMLEAHPELKKEKPIVVAKYWASLYHFAPYMAQDPLAAGAFIRQSLARGLPEEFGGPAPDTYSTLTDINANILRAKGQIDLKNSAVSTARSTFAKNLVEDYMKTTY